jgi:integrase
MAKTPRSKKLIADLPSGVGVSHSVNGRGDRYFRVRLGKRFTKGDIQTKEFKKLSDARNWIFGEAGAVGKSNGVLGLQAAGGASAFAITAAQIAEATWAYQQLGTTSLRDAVGYYLRHARPKGGTKKLSEVINAHLKAMEQRGAAESYRRAQRISCELLARELGDDLDPQITTVSKDDIQRILDRQAWKPLNRRNYLRDWSMLFRYAIKHDYLATNPIDKIERTRVPRQVPEIYTVDEAEQLLRIARDELFPILPFLCIGLFAGVRVEELRRLRWEMIDDEFIAIPSSVAKQGGEPRNIPIAPNLAQWLKICREDIGDVAPGHPVRWWTDRLYSRAGFRKRNALRHSFASYYLAYTDSPEKTQLALGQQTPSVLFKHYRQVVRRADADRYFNLSPKRV